MAFVRFGRRTKYGQKKTELAGQTFDSKAEATLYQELLLREKAGELENLRRQVRVSLTKSKIIYIADYCAFDTSKQKDIYFEMKGFETDVWKIKRRLWTEYGPSELHIYKGDYRRLKLHEVIIPDDKQEEEETKRDDRPFCIFCKRGR